MLRKLTFLALLLAVLVAGIAHPQTTAAQERGEPQDVLVLAEPVPSLQRVDPYKNYKFLVNWNSAALKEAQNQGLIRNRFTTEPPPPQKYHIWYYLPDLGILLDCVYDDDTGELQYCDIYA